MSDVYTWRDAWGSADELAYHIDVMADEAARRGRYDEASSLADAAMCIRDLIEELENAKAKA
jgi:hypothetical protein